MAIANGTLAAPMCRRRQKRREPLSKRHGAALPGASPGTGQRRVSPPHLERPIGAVALERADQSGDLKVQDFGWRNVLRPPAHLLVPVPQEASHENMPGAPRKTPVRCHVGYEPPAQQAKHEAVGHWCPEFFNNVKYQASVVPLTAMHQAKVGVQPCANDAAPHLTIKHSIDIVQIHIEWVSGSSCGASSDCSWQLGISKQC